MPINVLVVDDSQFFCRRVARILSDDPDIKVVGVAHNGQEAIAKVEQLKPDVITLDVEMPIMDGISALRQIMKNRPTPTLMLSSLTYEGARLTLDALDAGAVDFMLKSYEGISQIDGNLARTLKEKVKEIARSKTQNTSVERIKEVSVEKIHAATVKKGDYKLLAIGSSTGGPVAVQNILMSIGAGFRCPVLITQHMPATFTGAFAQRMNSLSQLNVVEAQDQMVVRPGWVYIAPGGKQTFIEGSAHNAKIRVRDTDARLRYAPCVDVTFASTAKVYGRHVLAIVLTGMGSDGRDGAKILKQAGSTVWTQDEKSCVVYGMPQSVKQAGLSDLEISLNAMAEHIKRAI